MLASVTAKPLIAATATSTVVSVSPSNIVPGQPAKLVATVTDASNKSVFPGTVTFYDGTRVLGTAQIVSHPGGSFAEGTATLNIASFDPGTNDITALFAGTKSYLSSTSPAVTLTVSGPNKTETALSVSGTSGNYDLTGTVYAFGDARPSGSIDFLNDTTGVSLGSLSLSGSTETNGLVLQSTQEGPDYLKDFGEGPSGLAVGDLNGDGLLDMAIAYDYSSAAVYLGKGDGTFAVPTYYPYKNDPKKYSNLVNVYFADFNNDGILDLLGIEDKVVNNNLSSNPVLFQGNGDGTFQAGIEVGIDQNGFGCVGEVEQGAVADFDRDGNLDFVMSGMRTVAPKYGYDQICVLRGNGDGTFQPPQVHYTPSLSIMTLNPIMAGDLNGDNFPDLVESVRTSSDQPEQRIWLGNGDGTFQSPVIYALGGQPGMGTDYSLRTPIIALGDLNADGKLDLVVSNMNAQTVTVTPGKGDGTFATPVIYPLSFAPGQPIIVDINRDGKPDIAVADYAVNSPDDGSFSIAILLGNGDGTFQPPAYYPVNSVKTDLLAQGDFNGDGLPDLLTGYDFGSTWDLLLNDKSASATLSGVDLTGGGTNSVLAQYSGDSKYSPSSSCDESLGVTPQSPKLNDIYNDHVTSTTAAVAWTSDFPTNGYVSYGTTKSLGQVSPFEHNATGFHFVNLTGLTPGTTYFYSVTSIAYFAGCDHWTTTSSVRGFTTATQ